MTQSNKGLEVKVGYIELIAPHNGKKLTFIHPAKGPDTYFNVGEQIREDDLREPTFSENISLVHASWQNPDNQYSKQVINLLRTNLFLGFTGILYAPKKGAYIQDHPKVAGNIIVLMDKRDLVKRLERKDKSVRFVPFGYKVGEQSASELAKNPFVIGLAGEEGAEKVAEIAANYSVMPNVWSFEGVNTEQIRHSALLSPTILNCRLYVDGNRYGYDRCGFAFGVRDVRAKN